jgi:hyperosmotically inducible protein
MNSFRFFTASLVLIGGAAVASSAFASGSSDSMITSEVQSRIDAGIHFDNKKHPKDAISVKTFAKVVSLNGFVDTAGQKEKAGEIAGGTAGVRDVRNDLVINHVKKGSH